MKYFLTLLVWLWASVAMAAGIPPHTVAIGLGVANSSFGKATPGSTTAQSLISNGVSADPSFGWAGLSGASSPISGVANGNVLTNTGGVLGSIAPSVSINGISCPFATGCAPTTGVYLEQYGGGTAVSDNTAAYNAAVAAFTANGGRINFLCGVYKFSHQISIPNTSTLYGCGQTGQTVLNWNNDTTAEAGILISNINGFDIERLDIQQTNGPGIQVTGNNGFGYIGQVEVSFEKLGSCFVLSGAGASLILTTFDHDWFRSCPINGVDFEGYGTSEIFSNVYVSTAGAAGFHINNLTYSSFISTAADSNGTYGYEGTNLNGVAFTSPGAESNPSGMFHFQTSTAIATGATSPDIKGVTITAPFSYNNGSTGSTPASTIEAEASNSRTLELSLYGGSDLTDPSGTSLYFSGSGAQLTKLGGTYAGSITNTGGATYSHLP